MKKRLTSHVQLKTMKQNIEYSIEKVAFAHSVLLREIASSSDVDWHRKWKLLVALCGLRNYNIRVNWRTYALFSICSIICCMFTCSHFVDIPFSIFRVFWSFVNVISVECLFAYCRINVQKTFVPWKKSTS